MASQSIEVKVRVQPWVADFLQAFAGVRLGPAGAAAISAYIARHGMRVEPRP